MTRRRDFLKLVGGALGGVVLSSCGGSGSGRAPYGPLPNGYRYFRLINLGDALPGGQTIEFLPGSAMINERGEIFFHARDNTGAMGCYALSVDFSGETPAVTSIRKVVRDGDTLADGNTVKKAGRSDINRSGSFATTLQLEGIASSGVYLDPDKGGLQPVAKFRDTAPGGDGHLGQTFGDLDLHDDNDILMVARFGSQSTGRTHQGLFHLPGASTGPQATLVSATGDPAPGVDAVIGSFGLVDRNNGGAYVTQTNIVPLGSVTARRKGTGRLESSSTALLMGNVKRGMPRSALAASRTLSVAPSAALIGGVASGDVIYGPRLGAQEDVAHIVHTADTAMELYFRGQKVAWTNGSSPKGDLITSLGPPVVGDNGLLYYSLFTFTGMELCVFNGAEAVTILSRGDTLHYDGDNVVTTIIFGSMTQQADSAGRLSMICEYNNDTSAVVAGVPV